MHSAAARELSRQPSISVESLLAARDRRAALAADVVAGLTATPKQLPPKWFYDERGSLLFDEITRLPEYYPTRRERLILRHRADEIAAASGADTLVELGSGTAEKTRLLLGAMARARSLRRYVPFDVSEEILLAASEQIAAEYPGIEVHAVAGDFELDLARLPREGRRMVAFLGGTIGNLTSAQRAAFLRDLRSTLEPGESLLLGTDLVKDVARLEAAYDDAAGVTRAFNLNVLAVLNGELDADFDLDRFEHVARFDRDQEWIEMRLRSACDQVVSVAAVGLEVRFQAGETIRTEISAKFRKERVADELAAAGFALAGWWSDPADDFALSLSIARA
jgi:L-histidine N-alpha-methyltransferase